MTGLQGLALAILIATFGAFALAMRRFQRPRKHRAVRWLILAAWGCTLIQIGGVVLAPPSSVGQLAAGLALCGLAQCLFWWALSMHGQNRPGFAMANQAPTTLQQAGPYAYVRHPIYSAYLCAWLAGPVFAGSAWLLLPMIGMAILYYRAAASEERSFGGTPFADAYRAYRRRTGMFLPRLVP